MIRFNRTHRQYSEGDTATLDHGIEAALVQRGIAEDVTPKNERLKLNRQHRIPKANKAIAPNSVTTR